jgi:hypothetical protein
MIWIKIYTLSVVISAVVVYVCSMDMLHKLEDEGYIQDHSPKDAWGLVGSHSLLYLFVPVFNLLVAGTTLFRFNGIYKSIVGELEGESNEEI